MRLVCPNDKDMALTSKPNSPENILFMWGTGFGIFHILSRFSSSHENSIFGEDLILCSLYYIAVVYKKCICQQLTGAVEGGEVDFF